MGHLRLLVVVAVLASACGPVVRFDLGDPVDFVQQPQTGEVVDIAGLVMAELHAEQDRRDVTLDQVTDTLEQAVVAIEDRRFLLHHGVDVAAIARAAVRNIEEGEITEGGSTITQQYVKNTITGPAVTLERKIQEAVAAWQLEDRYSKDEILERYLNSVYFGKGAYGIRAAARRFFGVEPADLTLPQAALLAGMIASPSGYDPYENPEASKARRSRVLEAMVDFGVVSRADADAADAEPLGVRTIAPDRFQAPYAVEEAKRIIRDDPDGTFTEALGADPDDRVAALFTDGLRIVTTIDLDVQRKTEAAVLEQMPAGAPTAAVVVTDPTTGAVRAIVGGRDFYDDDDPTARFNLATQGRRQPGSSFKPVVLALALERGTKLEEVFPGGPCVSFPDLQVPWAPCNYGNTDYPAMSLREATVRSVNTVYARLGVRLGSTALLEMASTLGFTGLPQVPSLALGTGEVTVMQMAGAYGTFANLGTYAEPFLIDRIETSDGKVLYRHDPVTYRAIEPSTAYVVTQALREVVRRGTGVRADIGRPQAGKTGTSQDSADAWFVGYTPDLVAAVWVGFPQSRLPMVPPNTDEVVEGGRLPAQIWQALASSILADVEPTPFEVPDLDLVVLEVDITRNCLPNPYTPPELVQEREYLAGTQPTERCKEPTGPPIDDVPNVSGLPFVVAERLLTDRGFVLDVRPIASKLYPPGTVHLQRPAAGGTTRSEDGNAVVVWVAENIRTFALVPDVVEVGGQQAIELLEEAGWVVEVVTGCPPDGCTGSGRVWTQSPAAGARERNHSLITITVDPVPE